ncbi:MAG TPA: alpha-2-macroglobulin family protein, partial [Chitinophagaceae bacterium]|nr:alpha-2-macroglobulin family protein [Chitinophagaceae bacterium]
YYEEKASGYIAYGDSTHRLSRVKAKEICERVLAQKDSSEGKINCYNLLTEINRKSLQFHIEKVNIPNQPFRALVAYRNCNTIYLRLIKADEKLKKELENQHGDKFWPAILAAKAEKNWQQNLPATNDLQEHKVEIKVDALPVGDYVLVAGTEKDFNSKKAILGARLMYVSNLSYVNNQRDYFILNRDNGQPVPNAAVQVWERKYDYKTSNFQYEKFGAYKTDRNGFFMVGLPKEQPYGNHIYQLEISSGNDRLFMNDYANDYYYYPGNRGTGEPELKHSIFLFADRSLYRPGQALFFKGIVLQRNQVNKSATVTENFSTKVYLRDANYQNIDSIEVKTNEFGSFNGKFQLPAAGLNGQFSIYTKTDGGQTDFRVEEYKRPKFYVEYEPIKGTYKVNDTIKLGGFAKAYAGNNIDGATVKYRVVRQPRFLYPWLFWRWPLPRTAEMEIAQGEVKTDQEGKFTIEFTAIPDLALDKKLEPVFDYRVYADVTDINGETRSGEKLITVGYKSLLLKTNIPPILPVDSLKSFSIRTENMNGQFEPSTVTVTIFRLEAEKRLIRPRYWERPDQFVMSRDEYIRLFPHDEYDNESDQRSWKKAGKVWEKKDSARDNGEWKIDNGKLTPGYYVVEIVTKDKDGAEVKDVKYLELFDDKSKELNRPQYLWSQAASPIEPGESTSVKLGSSTGELFMIHAVDKGSLDQQPPVINYSFVKLNNEKRNFDFRATEADRGGYGVSWIFVKHNRFYQYNQTIVVPWTNKDLTIEYASFRDKTLPGSEEKWKIRISGYKKEKIAAEMLASMYDASLDQFYPHNWNKPGIWPSYYKRYNWNASTNFSKIESVTKYIEQREHKNLHKQYDILQTFFAGSGYPIPFLQYKRVGVEDMMAQAPGIEVMANAVRDSAVPDALEGDASAVEKGQTSAPVTTTRQAAEVQIRKNFNETAFFIPDLKTDAEGNIEFSFTLPEALTRWKFQALAHTKEGAFGYSSKEIITQKELMLQPNAPRFLREGDKMEFSSKIVNLTGKEITGQVELQLFDASNNQSVDGWFKNMMPNQYFTIAAGQSESVKFPLEIPYLFNKALVWRMVAKAGNHSDGEENALPVLTNRLLVTETLPLPVRGGGTKEFSFDKLLKSGSSETLQHYAVTLEYTSNPAWYAVQALPYLMEYPYDCAEQNWNRYYANSLASMIANSSPRIKQVFEKWKTTDTAALLSNLQKNQELKSILLEETPWVLQAQSEAQQRKNIALLFDMVKMSQELSNSFEKLKQMQSSNGGFVWFKGGPDDYYITQYIVTGMGHLKKLNAIAGPAQLNKINQVLATAIPYLDRKIKEEYDQLVKNKADLKKHIPGYTAIHYLYMRSFFPEYKIPAASQKAVDYFRSRVQQNWTIQNKYMQGMTALALHRNGDNKTPAAILKSLKETSINHEELGMYWKDAGRSWWWYEAPIERQSLLIEAFQEISKDSKTVDDLRTWLLKNKQTNNWATTKATAEACYALLLTGTNWLNSEPVVEIKLGNSSYSSADNKQEAGTGYFKTSIEGKSVKPEMGNITVKVGSSTLPSGGGGTTWGAIYWQYFEDLDKITTASTPLKLVKKLFVEKNTDRGPVLTPVNDGDLLKVGDKIKVRIELRVDRDMEYVHMKDMRAAAMEPVNVLSSYKWQGGLGYYETTRDASTNFFFSYLRKGTYVFEYPLFLTHTGNFSNGITSIQCMYAPEFSSHSEGVRIKVE